MDESVIIVDEDPKPCHYSRFPIKRRFTNENKQDSVIVLSSEEDDDDVVVTYSALATGQLDSNSNCKKGMNITIHNGPNEKRRKVDVKPNQVAEVTNVAKPNQVAKVTNVKQKKKKKCKKKKGGKMSNSNSPLFTICTNGATSVADYIPLNNQSVQLPERSVAMKPAKSKFQKEKSKNGAKNGMNVVCSPTKSVFDFTKTAAVNPFIYNAGVNGQLSNSVTNNTTILPLNQVVPPPPDSVSNFLKAAAFNLSISNNCMNGQKTNGVTNGMNVVSLNNKPVQLPATSSTFCNAAASNPTTFNAGMNKQTNGINLSSLMAWNTLTTPFRNMPLLPTVLPTVLPTPVPLLPKANKNLPAKSLILSHQVAANNNVNLLRPIAIDGSNVAFSHGKQKVYSCLGIKMCVDFFLKRGHTTVKAFVPQFRRCKSREVTDQHLLEEMAEGRQNVVFTPSRKIGNSMVTSYDDRFIVEYACQTKAVIVSNDNYRDLIPENPLYKETIENRLLMYTFVDNVFMVPMDPLGRNGPNLETFLRMPSDSK